MLWEGGMGGDVDKRKGKEEKGKGENNMQENRMWMAVRVGILMCKKIWIRRMEGYQIKRRGGGGKRMGILSKGREEGVRKGGVT